MLIKEARQLTGKTGPTTKPAVITEIFRARPPRGVGHRQRDGPPGVVVFHAWWGFNDDIELFCSRLAKMGFDVAAPDLFDGAEASTIQEAEALEVARDEDHMDRMALAAVDLLSVPAARPIVAVGFSMGAAWATWAPSKVEAVAGTIVYYGTLRGPSIAKASTPVLGHFAARDRYEHDAGGVAFEASLRRAGRATDFYTYNGTEHWFAEPSRPEYNADAAERAFRRTVDFIRHVSAARASRLR